MIQGGWGDVLLIDQGDFVELLESEKLMAELVCPGCQTVLREDLVEGAGAPDCPFCGARLPDTFGVGMRRDVNGSRAEEAGRVARLWEEGESPSGEAELFASPPEGSKVQVIEGTAERAIFYVPGGWKRGAFALGFFALFWNGLLTMMTVGTIRGALNPPAGQAPPPLFLIPFLSVFWAIGLGILFWFLKLLFERLLLLVEQERLVIRRTLFGWERNKTISLGEKAAAALVVSYSQNERPVYAIAVEGTDGTIKFGTGLSDTEKDWFVDTINAFLQMSPTRQRRVAEKGARLSKLAPSTAQNEESPQQASGAPALADFAESVAGRGATTHVSEAQQKSPAEIREVLSRVGVAIDETDPQTLKLVFPISVAGPMRWVMVAGTAVIATVWWGFFLPDAFQGVNIRQPNPMDWVRLAFLIPSVVGGLMPLAVCLFCLAGRLRVTVTPESLRCRWSVGPLGYTRSLKVDAITKVAVMEPPTGRQNPRIKETRSDALYSNRICVAIAGTKFLPLTLSFDREVNEATAALVNERLEA